MDTTVYLHPQRTCIAHWSQHDGIPVLVSYDEISPSADVRAHLREDAACTVAVHASATRWHHFPVDHDEDIVLRRGFELATCMPDIDPDIDRVYPINEHHGSVDRTWCGITVIPRAIADDIAIRVGPEARVVPDTVCDIHAALTCTTQQDHAWALVGLRGDRWITAIIDPTHSIAQCAAFPYESTSSFEDGACESFYGIRSTTDLRVDHVLFFGDELTKARYSAIAARLATTSVMIGRLQPFRRVGASVDDSIKRSLLSVAHLLGPIVAPVLPSFVESETGANQ